MKLLAHSNLVQVVSSMQALTSQLESFETGSIDAGDFNRQQLKQMLSTDPFKYLNISYPKCSATLVINSFSPVMPWTRDTVQLAFNHSCKVREG